MSMAMAESTVMMVTVMMVTVMMVTVTMVTVTSTPSPPQPPLSDARG